MYGLILIANRPATKLTSQTVADTRGRSRLQEGHLLRGWYGESQRTVAIATVGKTQESEKVPNHALSLANSCTCRW